MWEENPALNDIEVVVWPLTALCKQAYIGNIRHPLTHVDTPAKFHLKYQAEKGSPHPASIDIP